MIQRLEDIFMNIQIKSYKKDYLARAYKDYDIVKYNE